jgi:protein phosphatase
MDMSCQERFIPEVVPTYTPFVQALSVEGGKLDVVGDIHGCMDELMVLLSQAGYVIGEFDPRGIDPIAVYHPKGRKLVLLGDLTDRGPYSDQVLRLAMGLHKTGAGCVIMGNHDWKLVRYLMGRGIAVPDSLQSTLDQILPLGDAFLQSVLSFYMTVPHQIRVPLSWETSYEEATSLWLVHAAAKEGIQGDEGKKAFDRSIYGYPLEELDEEGWLQREDWAQNYAGKDPVIHGHVIHAEPRAINRVLCLDTGCAFGNKLSLYQADTETILFEKAAKNYAGIERIFK